MSAKKSALGRLDDPGKELAKMLQANSHRHRLHTVFSDFCELCALTISNSVDLRQYATREARYLQIVGTYEREEVERFGKMFACLVEWLERGFGDRLGQLFMSLDLGNAFKGQFFTPYEISSLMAELTLGNVEECVERNGFIDMSEPACGSGGMVIACAQAMQHKGFNYQKTMHATLVDVDPTAVHMAYVQCSLYGIPAIVVHGNTLAMQEFGHWYTPMHILGGWARKRNNLAPGSALQQVEGQPSAKDGQDRQDVLAECIELLTGLPESEPALSQQDPHFEVQSKLFG